MASAILGTIRGIQSGIATINNEVSLRVNSLGSTAAEAGMGIAHLALAILNASFDVATFGSSPEIRKAAKELEFGFSKSCREVFISSLRILNPHAQINPRSGLNYTVSTGRFEYAETPNVLQRFSSLQQSLLNSLNGSRYSLIRGLAGLAAPLSTLVALVVGCVALVFAVLGAVLSTLFLGTITPLNTWTYDTLQTPGWMINQLHLGLLGFFRPHLV